MKKLGRMLMVMSLVGTMLVGCSGAAVDENIKVTEAEKPTEIVGVVDEMKKIGIVQIVEHPSLDTIRLSTIDALAEQGFVAGENVQIDYQNAQNDMSNLNTICSKFVGDKVDLIIAIATPSAQAAVAATQGTDIPVIFSAVTDPLAAQLVMDLEKPEGRVTGTSDAIPVDQVFSLCKELTPDVQKIGFLYTASEVNSKSVVDGAIALIDQYGYGYEVVTITNTSELQQAAQSLLGKVDAVYTPIDNTIASAMPVLAQAAKEAKKPLYVGADSLVADGGYATVGINYEDLGAQTGAMVAKVLNGAAVADLPVEVLNNFQKVINKTTAEQIGAPAASEGAIIVE